MDYKRIVIVPYNTGSGSAKRLCELLRKNTGLQTLIVPKTSKTYQPRWTDYVINWGCSKEWDWINTTKKEPNQFAVNKLEFFQQIQQYKDINQLQWTDDKAIASKFDGTVLCRCKLNGHSGDGIVIADTPEELVDAPLYVKYKKKRHEYRVHIFNGEIIDVTQKKKKKGADNLDTKIRNHKNGWVYCREDIFIPDDLYKQAHLVMASIGLKFGAVDLIWNEKENKCYALEVNTAPGLFETTLNKYVEVFIKDIKND